MKLLLHKLGLLNVRELLQSSLRTKGAMAAECFKHRKQNQANFKLVFENLMDSSGSSFQVPGSKLSYLTDQAPSDVNTVLDGSTRPGWKISCFCLRPSAKDQGIT